MAANWIGRIRSYQQCDRQRGRLELDLEIQSEPLFAARSGVSSCLRCLESRVAFTGLSVTPNAPIWTWALDQRRRLSLEPLADTGIALVLCIDFTITNPLEGLHEGLQNAPRQQANLIITPSRMEQVLYGDRLARGGGKCTGKGLRQCDMWG